MPLDALNQELDPYSTQVIQAFDRVGPAVVHITAFAKDGRPAGPRIGRDLYAGWLRPDQQPCGRRTRRV